MDKNSILRKIPAVDEILLAAGCHDTPPPRLLRAVRAVLDGIRGQILAGKIDANDVPDIQSLLAMANAAADDGGVGLRRVINATGIVLHTNLGRAPMAKSAAEFVYQVSLGYNNLEYNLDKGARGSRMDAVETQLIDLCGCEAALCVNNNAAAVLLVLTALCKGRNVIVSRGELVEIGGSFRVPEIISQGGARLVEVGTTNKVRLSDYVKVLSDETAAILKVHTSNYRIVGYTQDCGLAELAPVTRDAEIPLIYDLGGGALVPLSASEPTVQEALNQGADILCFSGDKLLGGPQAGIIVGKKTYIDTVRKHPLYRALRMDKLSLAALQATLQLYTGGAYEDVPTLAMLKISADALKMRAENLLAMINSDCVTIVETSGQVGGGSLPGEDLPSYAIAIAPGKLSLQEIETALRGFGTPIVGRISRDRLLLDVRAIGNDELGTVAAAVNETLRGK